MRVFIALDIEEVIRERLQTLRGRSARIRTRGALGAARVDACDSEIHRGEISRGRGGDQARLWAQSEPAPLRFRFAAADSSPLLKRHAFSGSASKLVRSLPLWPSQWTRLRLFCWRPERRTCFQSASHLGAQGGSGSPRWRKGDAPNQSFQRLQEKLAAMPAPEFGTMTAREFFLYESQLDAGRLAIHQDCALWVNVAPGVPPAVRRASRPPSAPVRERDRSLGRRCRKVIAECFKMGGRDAHPTAGGTPALQIDYLPHRRLRLSAGIDSLRLYPGAHFSGTGYQENRQRQHWRHQRCAIIAGPGSADAGFGRSQGICRSLVALLEPC